MLALTVVLTDEYRKTKSEEMVERKGERGKENRQRKGGFLPLHH